MTIVFTVAYIGFFMFLCKYLRKHKVKQFLVDAIQLWSILVYLVNPPITKHPYNLYDLVTHNSNENYLLTEIFVGLYVFFFGVVLLFTMLQILMGLSQSNTTRPTLASTTKKFTKVYVNSMATAICSFIMFFGIAIAQMHFFNIYSQQEIVECFQELSLIAPVAFFKTLRFAVMLYFAFIPLTYICIRIGYNENTEQHYLNVSVAK